MVCPRGAHSTGLCPGCPSHWGMLPGHLTEEHWEGQYAIHCTCYPLLFILYSESQYKGKSNPTKLGAMYGTHSYSNGSNKKISKTPPDKFQARSKERNGETKAVEAISIYKFQLSCIQFPAKGFSCDEQGCKIQRQDTVCFYDSFQVAEYKIPALLSPRAIHLPQVMESHSPSGWSCSHRP